MIEEAKISPPREMSLPDATDRITTQTETGSTSRHSDPLKVDTLAQAWWTVKRNSLYTPIRDVVDFADYDGHFSALARRVQNQLARRKGSEIIVEFWKAPRRHSVRFVALPDVVTRVSLQSLALSIAPIINSLHPPSTISRPSPIDSRLVFANWYADWSIFLIRIVQLARRHKFVVFTDIANFFDSISFAYIRKLLSQAGVPNWQIDVVSHLLAGCARLPGAPFEVPPGLPQLYDDAAMVLGNFYLHEFDLDVINKWGAHTYLRWIDDIALGVNSEREGAVTIASLSEFARRRGITLNAYKTRIIESGRLGAEHLCLDAHHELDELEFELAVETHSSTTRRLRTAFASFLRRNRRLLERRRPAIILRRIYRIAGALGDRSLLAFVFDNLLHCPESYAAFADYLGSVPWDERIPEIVAKYIGHPANMYEPVEVLLLRSMVTRPPASWSGAPLRSLAQEILANRIRVSCDVSMALAAMLLLKYARHGENRHVAEQLQAAISRTRSEIASRYLVVGLFLSNSRFPSQAMPRWPGRHHKWLTDLLKTGQITVATLFSKEDRKPAIAETIK